MSNRHIDFCEVWENDVLAQCNMTTDDCQFIANEFHSYIMNFNLASYILEKLLRDLAGYLESSNWKM